MVKYFEYRAASGNVEETWLLYSAADQANDNVFLSLVEYRRSVEQDSGTRVIEAYWCESGPMPSTIERAEVPPIGASGDAALTAMLADSFARLGAGVS